ncbi:SDR family NAD(P)-dependent oxidoreductase [Allostreptomyces psammosilenae]|uniref:NAD(P)-dependent dehydrogenase (Short-subunit alcohol dehydrogenase family) n=1 Tax=Allostreptomyces psammosilenae TaxID=1892865 RepID=A0A853A189_9ACTN|nr:SDR family NAD(P)-dependent oxidoreductase [Allostreptomyces psammosilenae]NYI07210.1 NAD(P)-dependent dehydrogenase (short-subunit alcohol dehydrogenase family) [Allostreptomyces psammosilenae]
MNTSQRTVNPGRFQSRRALVAGGGTGLGRVVARALAAEGATVVVAGRTEATLRETVRLIEADGGRAQAVTADLTDAADARRLVDDAVGELGGLDVAVNAVGILRGAGQAVADIAEEDWDAMLAANVTGTWLFLREVVRAMRASGGGAIVTVSSDLGPHIRIPGMGAYAATKAAVSALTRAAARDHIAEGIRINAVSPGALDTPMSLQPGETEAERALRMKEQSPLGRVGTLEEVASAILHLASEESGYTVGADLVIDGGAAA